VETVAQEGSTVVRSVSEKQKALLAWLRSAEFLALEQRASEAGLDDALALYKGEPYGSAVRARVNDTPVLVHFGGTNLPLVTPDRLVLRTQREWRDGAAWVHIWEEADPPPHGLILGVTKKGHDSSAALIDSHTGSLVAFRQEERISRVKHERRFPRGSIEAVLHEAKATAADLAGIAVGHGLRWYDRLPGESHTPADIDTSRVPDSFVKKDLKSRNSAAAFAIELRGALALKDDRSLPPLFCVRHHLAHVFAARTCAAEGTHRALVADGRGEWDTITLWEAGPERVDLLRRAAMPISLGYFYNAFGDLFGWRSYGFEGRLMGLAPYGRPRSVSEEITLASLEEFLLEALSDAPEFPFVATNTAVFQGGYNAARVEECTRNNWWVSPFVLAPGARADLLKLVSPLTAGESIDTDNERHRSLCILAYAIQSRLTAAWMRLCRHAVAEARGSALLVCGGVALNAVANGEVSKQLFGDGSRLLIPPFATDEGLSIGAASAIAWLCYATPPIVRTAQIGRDAASDDIEREIVRYGIEGANRLTYSDAVERTAEALRRGESVAVFHGREEAGPRALGARSILLPADRPDSFGKANTAKAREPWRPLALAVLEENVPRLFEHAAATPYMNVCLRSRTAAQNRYSSGLHPADGTTRIQLVTRSSAPFLYDILRNLETSGVHAVINTSFNRKEPIVHRAREALDTFWVLGAIDHLLLSYFWIGSGSYEPGLLSAERHPGIRQALLVTNIDFERGVRELARWSLKSHQARLEIRSTSTTITVPAWKELYDAQSRRTFCHEAVAHGWQVVAYCGEYPELQRAFDSELAH
jgi:carbamoyltransferase